MIFSFQLILVVSTICRSLQDIAEDILLSSTCTADAPSEETPDWIETLNLRLMHN